MKRHLRCAAAWLLYWIGEGSFRLLEIVPQSDRWEWLARPFGRVYHASMVASSALDRDDCGLWRRAYSSSASPTQGDP